MMSSGVDIWVAVAKSLAAVRPIVPARYKNRPRGSETGVPLSSDRLRDLDRFLVDFRHHASSVKHQQYHNVDILTVWVDRV